MYSNIKNLFCMICDFFPFICSLLNQKFKKRKFVLWLLKSHRMFTVAVDIPQNCEENYNIHFTSVPICYSFVASLHTHLFTTIESTCGNSCQKFRFNISHAVTTNEIKWRILDWISVTEAELDRIIQRGDI